VPLEIIFTSQNSFAQVGRGVNLAERAAAYLYLTKKGNNHAKSHENAAFPVDTAVLELVHDVLSFRFSQGGYHQVQMKTAPEAEVNDTAGEIESVKKAVDSLRRREGASALLVVTPGGNFQLPDALQVRVSQAWRPTSPYPPIRPPYFERVGR